MIGSMCMFSPPVRMLMWPLTWFRRPSVAVAHTKIFARVDRARGQQIIVYTMSMSSPSDVAMILPVPTVAGAGEQALEFVDLSGYPRFFNDLESRFFIAFEGPPKSRSPGPSLPRLKVHRVGSFEASFVPSLADFDRLDPRFRLPDDVWAQFPNYSDDGFAVFKLRRGARRKIHPMALRFQTRVPGKIYFPTTHVHNGRVPRRANFNHLLYYQSNHANADDACSQEPAGAFVDISRTRSLVDAELPVYLHEIHGPRDNSDVFFPS